MTPIELCCVPRSDDDWDALAPVTDEREATGVRPDAARSQSGIFAIPFRPPRPVACIITRLRDADGGYTTVIAREWRPEDMGRCRLCPKCTLQRPGLCQIAVPGWVREEDAPLCNLASPPPSCPPEPGGGGGRPHGPA